MSTSETLECSTCLEDKPKSKFFKNSSLKRGYQYQCKTCKGALDKKLYNSNEAKSNKRLKRYGITEDDYNLMFQKQQGCCAICNSHQSNFKRALAVDHCHETGKVRGLLCTNCNVGLGNFKDSLTSLSNAMVYLTKEG
jgi:hypothetical protein